MSVTAELVKTLRERTGAGMMECKKALLDAEGDLETAMIAMRKAGQAKAVKRAGRVASEGVVITRLAESAQKAVVVEVNCETDFVARDLGFKQFAEQVAVAALSEWCFKPAILGNAIEEARQTLITKIGENIQIRRIAGLDATEPNSFVAAYQHGSKIGTLVHTIGGTIELAKDLAMHIAASNPEVISAHTLSSERMHQEKEIFRAQALSSGKPTPVVEKMVEGMMKNFMNEISLLGQEFIKDSTKTIETLLKEHQTSVVQFVRYELGEGLEKRKVNFVEEVMAQVRGA